LDNSEEETPDSNAIQQRPNNVGISIEDIKIAAQAEI